MVQASSAAFQSSHLFCQLLHDKTLPTKDLLQSRTISAAAMPSGQGSEYRVGRSAYTVRQSLTSSPLICSRYEPDPQQEAQEAANRRGRRRQGTQGEDASRYVAHRTRVETMAGSTSIHHPPHNSDSWRRLTVWHRQEGGEGTSLEAWRQERAPEYGLTGHQEVGQEMMKRGYP